MRLRGYLGLTTALVTGGLILGACATGRSPPPPPPPAPGAVLRSDATGVVVQNAQPAPPKALKGQRTKGALIDPSCRYCVTDDPKKRQYFDQRRNRYYYFDRAKRQYYWENGEPKA